MGKRRIIELAAAQREALKEAFRRGPSHAFRQRCQMVLLKSEGRTSQEVAPLVKQHYVSVNAWLNRYQQGGLEGLRTKPGRGRKALLNKDTDAALVGQMVANERQPLKQAKGQIEAQTGRTMSLKTLQRFLKNLTATTDAFD